MSDRSCKESQLRQWVVATAVLAVAGGLAVAANAPSLYLTYEYAKGDNAWPPQQVDLAFAGWSKRGPSAGLDMII